MFRFERRTTATLHTSSRSSASPSYLGVLVPLTGAHAETPDSVCTKLAAFTGLAAEAGGKLVGVVFIAWHADHVYFDRLAVLSAFQGRGVASSLIIELERRAAVRAVWRVALRTRLALPDNIAFFERLGYRIYRRSSHPETGSETYALLEKHLAHESA